MRILGSIILLFGVFGAIGQGASEDNHQSEHEEIARHGLQLALSHTHVSAGIVNGDREWLILPSWGFNYNYAVIPHRLSLGLHLDMIVEKFEVERHNSDVVLDRTRPIAIAAMAGYKVWGPLLILGGGGLEIAPEESFGFVRLGLEPVWPFGDGLWEFSLVTAVDIKFNAYNSWMFGFGITRLFGR